MRYMYTKQSQKHSRQLQKWVYTSFQIIKYLTYDLHCEQLCTIASYKGSSPIVHSRYYLDRWKLVIFFSGFQKQLVILHIFRTVMVVSYVIALIVRGSINSIYCFHCCTLLLSIFEFCYLIAVFYALEHLPGHLLFCSM